MPRSIELAHRIGLQIDADAERAHVPDGFEDDAGHADLVERQGCRQPADAAAGDDYKIIRHTPSPIRSLRTSFILWPVPRASRPALRRWRCGYCLSADELKKPKFRPMRKTWAA